MRRALVGAGTLLAIGVCVSACTGSSGLTKAEYVERANAVCRTAAKRVAALEVPGRTDVTALPKAAAKVVVVQREALEELRAIKAPKDDRAHITKWIALVDQTIDQAEMSAKSQQEGDVQRAVTANVNGAALDVRADELARAYGLRMCVQAATAPAGDSTTPAS
jgi:ABC-type enterochelin transport system substrate-binding protein